MSFSYDRASGRPPALDDVSLRVAPGEIVAVVGANGSGKSTLVRLANGMLLPDTGSVTVDGVATAQSHDSRHASGDDVRRLVGAVFQHPDDQIVATSVEDDVAFGPENLGLPRDEIRVRVDDALATVGLTGLERREPHLLSGGQKQRLAIAGALAMSPRYLVFDEPTSMLDPQGRLEVLGVIGHLRDAGHGVLLVTHDLAEAARADRVLVLDRGRVAFEGATRDLYAQPDLGGWGLETPPIIALVGELVAAGVEIDPATVDPTTIVGALCR